METNSDFNDLLQALNDGSVKYLIVGAYAVSAYSRPRATGDIDIWVEPTLENSRRTYRALAMFGAPLEQIDERYFSDEDHYFQIGVPPRRIDILAGIDGVAFASAWDNRLASAIGSVTVHVIGLEDLMHNKRESGRPKDLADLTRLRADNGL